MNDKDLIETARDNLARVIGLFPRTDTLLSVLLAMNLGLVAVLASNAPPVKGLDGYAFFSLIFILLSCITFYHLYKCAFPRLDGGHTSFIYFREIANKKGLGYSQEFKDQSEDDYLDDLLEQVWRNSTILKEKYHHLQWAFIFLLLSLVFWLPALLIFISKHNETLLNR